jgi:NAD(P)-dependent dehydrogenase (short-subunit alcohol dehydrogenase family)
MFDNMVVLVTGGTGALGKHVSRTFLEGGADVTATYIDEEERRETEEFLSLRHLKQFHMEHVDVTNQSEVNDLITDIVEEHGHLDFVIHLVGGYVGGKPVHQHTEEEFDQMIDLNLRSAFTVAHEAVPELIEHERGRIITVSARAADDLSPGSGLYAASKQALQSMTEIMGKELNEEDVNVNAIVPSVIDTEANREAMPDADVDDWVDPDRIADIIAFLCSDTAEPIHSDAIKIYGDS